ncbi:pyridoxamine 5'-phosphate oxidase family protein [Gryllotalpicola protaetiae]|uniref:Pyridoxamine 5'-phosphate oxidase family protein n=1 Tax=Gryllotalpicola protaetiae TaxID=2419771 RepID=A0A387BKS2_9MICO|nr:pyridoxamine 5'-phosphate oxidase family protein [Gryllotalpicola protaetiae]AYG02764.1 pyridoxamine 5'-phosphate oxidase family protein [Gryllotalpicola protaetiae]
MNDASPNLTIHRKRERQTDDPAVLDEILAEGQIAHVGVVRDGVPIVLPFLYGVGDLGDGRGRQLLLHGSTGGGLFLDAGEAGVPVSATITHLDGLVYARSLNDSSANYRSAMIYGRASVVPIERRLEALWLVGDHLMPGRRAGVREITPKELAATQVLRVPLDRVSVKVRHQGVGEATDDGEDHGVWAGILPLAVRAGSPITSAVTDAGVPVPADVTALAAALEARAAGRDAALIAKLAPASA